MCTQCGCGSEEQHDHLHNHDHGVDHAHHHVHEHLHEHTESEQVGESSRIVSIETDILSKNNRLAAANRELFRHRGVFVLNLVSSPGSGKTSILERTMRDLSSDMRFAVIEGDQQTDNDAARIAATGVPVKQVNTGAGCHLDAHMVCHALESFNLDQLDVLMIENVGNLVCPASFDLGEHHKVVILSVTEGEDKPLKYPAMFHNSDLMLINKIDLLPHLEFDVEKCKEMARRVNPDIEIIELSARTGEGMASWCAWLEKNALYTAVT
jgi:hydrogenase nickel incorporation protein HypB